VTKTIPIRINGAPYTGHAPVQARLYQETPHGCRCEVVLCRKCREAVTILTYKHGVRTVRRYREKRGKHQETT
jgi:hypothetical protein